jgi:DNA-binding NtrC family response regulator
MGTQVTFLLIGVREKFLWFRNLERALTALGKLQVMPEREAMQDILQREYDLIIVDAAATVNEWLLISRVRSQRPKGCIIIVTASPTWRRAREVLQAGAMDYINKSLSEEEFLSVFKNAIAKSLRLGHSKNSGGKQ